MRRYILLFILAFAALGVSAQSGIRFEHGTWQEVKDKAVRENKLIFADFFTEWCGPCLAMAEDVFPLMEIGNFYNTHFVNVKVDAEKGEGLNLREKYQVAVYPTFLFIDPKTEELVHRSTSRQDAETFLFTGKSAVDPEMRSFYLEREYANGNRNVAFLCNYMDFLASMYRRDELTTVVKEYTARKEFSLENKEDWNVFVKHVIGVDNSEFKKVLEQKGQFDALYGKEAVDAKLYKEFNMSVNSMDLLKSAPEFKGRDFLVRKNVAEGYVREKNYDKAIPLLDELMANPGNFKEELCNYLRFVARTALYGEHSADWMKKCAQYAQYVAYNSYNRMDPMIHYDYATILEALIRQLPDAGTYFPESIISASPRDYNMRSPLLKEKPKRQKSKK